MFGPSGLWTMAPLRYAAKFDQILPSGNLAKVWAKKGGGGPVMIRAPGLGEKEPPVEKGDTVRVKLDDDMWLLLEVSGVQRDTLSIRVSSG